MRKYLSQLCSIGGIIVIIIMSKTDVFTKNFQTRGNNPFADIQWIYNIDTVRDYVYEH